MFLERSSSESSEESSSATKKHALSSCDREDEEECATIRESKRECRPRASKGARGYLASCDVSSNTLPSVFNASDDPMMQFSFVPLRLSADERVLLNVLENALEVCEYTDVVDVTFSHTRKSKQSRILECLVDVLSISCGLLVSFAAV